MVAVIEYGFSGVLRILGLSLESYGASESSGNLLLASPVQCDCRWSSSIACSSLPLLAYCLVSLRSLRCSTVATF